MGDGGSALFERLIEHSDIVVSVHAADGKMTYASPGMIRLLGYAHDEHLGMRVSGLAHPDDLPEAQARFAELALHSDQPVTIKFRIRHKDGHYVHVESNAINLLADPAVRGLVMYHRDVSALAEMQQRLAAQEEALLHSEKQLREIIDAAPIMIHIRDEAGRYVLVNQSYASSLGKSIDALEGKHIRDVFPGPDVERTLALDRETFERNERSSRDFEVAALPRRTIIRTIRTPFRTLDGKRAVLSASLDITDLHDAEKLRTRATELEEQTRRFAEASRMKSEFLANMSHELRTPLNAIIGFTQLIYDGHVSPESPHHREFLADILRSGQHLLQLINDILDLAKVESGKLVLRPEKLALGALLDEVAAVVRGSMIDRQVDVQIEPLPELGELVLDPQRCKQIVFNYLSNAVKFTPDGGSVVVRVRDEGPEQFRIEVADTGIGIATRDLPRLFVEFEQLQASPSKRHAGSGLGLALTKRLVAAQGGSVGVLSHVGQGSTFWAILPRRAHAPMATPPRPLRGRTILIIEDDPLDRAELEQTLTNAGYAVEIATTGAAALAMSDQRSFDAMTLDLLLPDMNGLDLLGALRASGRNRHVPIIVVTVVADARALLGVAVNETLYKPIDGRQLLASLARLGSQHDSATGEMPVFTGGGGSSEEPS